MDTGQTRVPRILVADDDPVVGAVLSGRLAPDFEVVAVAGDAAEAVDLAAEHAPDAAIVDVQMPGGGGLEAARGIRRSSPRTAIVAFSADESRQGVLDMLDAGAMTYVRKTAAHDELVKRLRAAIAAHGHLA